MSDVEHYEGDGAFLNKLFRRLMLNYTPRSVGKDACFNKKEPS